MSATRVPIGITLGDPAGVGPEVLLRALADAEIAALGPFRLYAVGADLAAAHAALAARAGGLFDPTPALRGEEDGLLHVRAVGADPAAGPLAPGRFDPRRAAPQRAALVAAVEDARAGRVAAVVTGPVNKAIFASAGGGPPEFPGQSELLAALTGTSEWAMMLAGERLRVVLVTTHLAIRDVAAALTEALVVRRAHVALGALRERFGIAQPRLAVAALNPHAGDGGLMGDEEQRVLAPAVRRLRADGHAVEGPFPADTLFARAVDGGFDAVLAMYHDQGLIPLKLVDFGRAVNVTLGLPIVRTSPDHGVAYDIAGEGRADPGGMRAAIRLAARLAGPRESAVPGR